MEKKTKACPFCWEEILETAKKCKHCWEMLKTEEEIEEEKNFQPKVYWKNKAVKILTIGVCWFFALSILFMWMAANSPTKEIQEQVNEEWETVQVEVEVEKESEWWTFIFLMLLCTIPVIQMTFKKLIIDKDHVTLKRGVFFRKQEDIKYNKINNIQQSSFLWMWWVKIFTWNDKPAVFNNLEDYEEVIAFINKKINR